MKKIDGKLFQSLSAQGFDFLREIEGRGICGVKHMLYTTALCYGIDEEGSFKGRFCFDTHIEASFALCKWDGKDLPEGEWIKHKAIGIDENRYTAYLNQVKLWVKELVGNEYLYLDTAIDIESEAFKDTFFGTGKVKLWVLCVSPANDLYCSAGSIEDQWYEVTSQPNDNVAVESIYPYVKNLFNKIKNKK